MDLKLTGGKLMLILFHVCQIAKCWLPYSLFIEWHNVKVTHRLFHWLCYVIMLRYKQSFHKSSLWHHVWLTSADAQWQMFKKQQNTESLLISFELQRTSHAAKLMLLNSRLSVILYLNECFLIQKLGGMGLLYVCGAKKHFSPFKSFMACHLPDDIFIKGKKSKK